MRALHHNKHPQNAVLHIFRSAFFGSAFVSHREQNRRPVYSVRFHAAFPGATIYLYHHILAGVGSEALQPYSEFSDVFCCRLNKMVDVVTNRMFETFNRLAPGENRHSESLSTISSLKRFSMNQKVKRILDRESETKVRFLKRFVLTVEYFGSTYVHSILIIG